MKSQHVFVAVFLGTFIFLTTVISAQKRNDLCQSNDDCSQPDLQCHKDDSTETLGHCACKIGYRQLDDVCLQPVIIGFECDIDTQCIVDCEPNACLCHHKEGDPEGVRICQEIKSLGHAVDPADTDNGGKDKPDQGLSTAAIAGISVTVVVLLILLGLCVVCRRPILICFGC